MSAATGIETVYLVDDDPSVLRAISRLLRAAGLQVVTFESGQAFIDAHDPKQRGCVVVDVGLPRMTGLELQQLLRARGSAMAVIFLTGGADACFQDQAMRQGAAAFLTKPPDGDALIAAIRGAFRE